MKIYQEDGSYFCNLKSRKITYHQDCYHAKLSNGIANGSEEIANIVGPRVAATAGAHANYQQRNHDDRLEDVKNNSKDIGT